MSSKGVHLVLKIVPLVFVCVCTTSSQEEDGFTWAQIGVSVLDSGSRAVVNTTYMIGVFGQSSLTGPVTGQLVHVRSEGGVNEGCMDYNHDLPTHDWVALVERGTCMFQRKIWLATKQYNATAIIVFNNQAGGPNVIMNEVMVDDEVYVFVKQAPGRHLALLVDAGLHVQVNISSALVNAYSSAGPLVVCPVLLLFCLLVLACLLVPCQV